MLVQLAGYYSARIITQAELVAALFGAGEQGAFYDPSDSATVFQERTGAAATTPAGADDPVGTILDLSGRGNHATAPSDASRPLLKTAGGLWWLQFDGVDDVLATVTLPAFTLAALCAGIRAPTAANGSYAFGQHLTSSDTTVFYKPFTELRILSGPASSGGSSNNLGDLTTSAVYLANISGTNTGLARRNRGADAWGSLVGKGTTSAAPIRIGARTHSPPAGAIAMDYFGGVLRHGSASTAQAEAMEDFIASKAGITL